MHSIVAGIRPVYLRHGRAATRTISALLALTVSSCTISATDDTADTTAPVAVSSIVSDETTVTEPTTEPSTEPSTGPTTTAGTTTTASSTTPVATAAPTTTGAPSDPRPLALDLLLTVTVENERPDGYVRDLFDHWITQPSGCSTREAVLIRDAIGQPQVDPFGCTVVEGDWISAYDGAAWIYPSDIDIDHVVALKEAWDSGAWNWSEARRRAFANDLTDPRTLRAVTDNVNQSKSDQDPSNWMPPLRSYWCTYLGDWVAIKVRWRLSMDQSEFGRIRNLLRDECPGWRIDPVAPAPG